MQPLLIFQTEFQFDAHRNISIDILLVNPLWKSNIYRRKTALCASVLLSGAKNGNGIGTMWNIAVKDVGEVG